MLMKMASCAALALCALTANAADQAFEWSFKGFTDKNSVEFSPNLEITGQFVVNDLNQDGVFDLAEVKSFTYHEVSTEPCLSGGDTTCGLSSFSYNPTGALSFGYQHRQTNGGWGSSHWIETGKQWGGVIWWAEDGEDYAFHWGDKTIMTVTAVPEPHSYLMLGAGLLSLAAFTRRRKHNQAQERRI